MLGADAMALILAQLLMRAGIAVSVLERDPDVAKRLGARFRQLGLGVPVVSDTAAALEIASRARLTVRGSLGPNGNSWPGSDKQSQQVLICDSEVEAQAFLSAGTVPSDRAALRLAVPGSGLAEIFLRDHDFAISGPVASVMARLGCASIRLLPGQQGPVPRLLARYLATAEALCMAGVPPWELDEALENIGFQFGPCALMDRLGLDKVLHGRAQLKAQGCILPDPGIIQRMVTEGRLGRKSSVGWYRYPGGGGQVTDPLIEDLVREEAWFARIPQRAFDACCLQNHIVAAVLAEAQALLAESAISRPSDADLATVLALGFPTRLGGALWLGEQLGTDWCRTAIANMQADLSDVADSSPVSRT